MLRRCCVIFQPTRPLRGATGLDASRQAQFSAFQPTRPLRGATIVHIVRRIGEKFQPTRPLRGATNHKWDDTTGQKISTHAPLAGRDAVSLGKALRVVAFQPTRPLRGATRLTPYRSCIAMISTHAPLAGRDVRAANRSPIGNISTHAPLAGRDLRALLLILFPLYFNPRAPCGARQQKSTNHYAHFCDNRQISDAFAQNAACQGILLLFDAGKPCGFWVRTAQVISAHLCFAL